VSRELLTVSNRHPERGGRPRRESLRNFDGIRKRKTGTTIEQDAAVGKLFDEGHSYAQIEVKLNLGRGSAERAMERYRARLEGAAMARFKNAAAEALQMPSVSEEVTMERTHICTCPIFGNTHGRP